MSIEPLLMRFSTARTNYSEIPGRYDDDRHVWTIETARGPEPIVESEGGKPIVELATKTEEVRERDDPGVADLLELSTKTSSQLERDDVDPRDAFLELITVTKIAAERSDI